MFETHIRIASLGFIFLKYYFKGFLKYAQQNFSKIFLMDLLAEFSKNIFAEFTVTPYFVCFS